MSKEIVKVCNRSFAGKEVSRDKSFVLISHPVEKDDKPIGNVDIKLPVTSDALIKLMQSAPAIADKVWYNYCRQEVQDVSNTYRMSFDKPAPLLSKEQKEAIKGLDAEKKAALEKKMADLLKEFKL